jgi:hypothetical protein
VFVPDAIDLGLSENVVPPHIPKDYHHVSYVKGHVENTYFVFRHPNVISRYLVRSHPICPFVYLCNIPLIIAAHKPPCFAA